MIVFARTATGQIYAVQSTSSVDASTAEKLNWLFNGEVLSDQSLEGTFIGPRKEMITPWSTNAVEITQNMGLKGIERIEVFDLAPGNDNHDTMLQAKYNGLDQHIFTIAAQPEPVLEIEDVAAYNEAEGLALSQEEVDYLNDVSIRLERRLTDSEVFGFSQVNSEHCRHKIFNGTFIIDGKEKPSSLFKLIKKTSSENPNKIVSAYKDNVAFVAGPEIEQFAPDTQNKPDYFSIKKTSSVLSVKAETHNFPTTVEPFNGAATGSGGEIRDRMAGGKASMPLAGTAVYMAPYSRLENGRKWEDATEARPWLYQSPIDILIKASNGASDFGNKFGQPLITGSVLTFEHEEAGKKYGYDKVIMQAGGIGYGLEKDSLKEKPAKGDKIVVMGGDNYRIGMGGSAVSSVATGEFSNNIELNAIQRSNPEMQKRVSNAIRAMAESGNNPIVSIHDHGAGGHLNCLSELVEDTGGTIDVRKLPIGDPTLSAKEIVGNESQERMGLVIREEDVEQLKQVADRERAPLYVVGTTTGDMHFKFHDSKSGENPINWGLSDMFGNPPKTILEDSSARQVLKPVAYSSSDISGYLEQVLQLEAVACKDWLTNKVDRSVTGKVAKQQTCGELQLPLNDVGVMALDYKGKAGLATAIGHAPLAALADERAGSVLAIAESLTNIVWAPLTEQLKSVSLSANWMWPAKNEGENNRLYNAVEAVSEFACALGINIPTGKDSLSMVQKYPSGDKVYAPGTVIISSAGEVSDIRKVVSPNLQDTQSSLVYIDFSSDEFNLGGSSFAQINNNIGDSAPTVRNAAYFKQAFNAVQELIENKLILAGHDISAGGMITTLLEMCFPSQHIGLDVDISNFTEKDILKILFSENPGVLIQINDTDQVKSTLENYGVSFSIIGKTNNEPTVKIKTAEKDLSFNVSELRNTWFKTSYLLDKHQTKPELATSRFENYASTALSFSLPAGFKSDFASQGIDPNRSERTGLKAAIIREKGVNGDREMAYVMHLAGFDVKDVHMTDLIAGRETLEDIQFIVFVGGFSNSDVLGSAKGWAGAFLYNEKAKTALENFYARPDTMSLGVCNGCQLMVELGLIYPNEDQKPTMLHNESGKFESAFLGVQVPDNKSIMLESLANSELGIWVAHGEGKFNLPAGISNYEVAMKYSASHYPANPNGSDGDTAAIVSRDGRHLAMMPHLERAFYPWQCANYPSENLNDDCTPWLEAFVNARKWVAEKKGVTAQEV